MPTVRGGGKEVEAVGDNGDEVAGLDCEIECKRSDLENGTGNRECSLA